MPGTLPRRVGRLILVFSYLAFLASLTGLAYSLYVHSFLSALIFAVNLVSMSLVKHLYSRNLCRDCEVVTCPFNPRRRGGGSGG